ncbi:MAG: DinB family protein [Acidimicrobiales bacterium]
MELIDPDHAGDELTLLTQFLEYQRAVLARKAQGLTAEQLAVTLGRSELTIGGLLKHGALVEDRWFQERLAGRDIPEPWASVDWDADPDWEFHTATADPPEELSRLYDVACERSRAVTDEVRDLDAMSRKPNRRGEHYSLRWILIHMIEETARHAGHADLLRESIDGATGD